MFVDVQKSGSKRKIIICNMITNLPSGSGLYIFGHRLSKLQWQNIVQFHNNLPNYFVRQQAEMKEKIIKWKEGMRDEGET